MRTREQLEQGERRSLASYGMASAATRGRHFPEQEAPYRTAFQRDRERVLHTTAFRRLQGKTQVFVVTEGDYYRTRITHTLEVAQIGRTLARALGANEDLVEGICLAHDLGHPPFGHAGEHRLNELMAEHGGFNHNAQSFRIITELEQRYADFPGLNLTYEFREGILKHQADHALPDTPEEYEPRLRGTLESQIAAIADELAYNAHDLDDGLRAGLIDGGDVRRLGWWLRACDDAGVQAGGPFTDVIRHRVIRRLIGLMVTDALIESSVRIERMVAATGASPTVHDVRRWPAVLVGFPDETARLNLGLKACLFERLYDHPRVIRMTNKAERVLTDLFGAYVQEPRMLGSDAQNRLATLPLQRVVCDYVAGMTDRFALDEHARLFDPHERV
jgi:dGTPase